MIISHGRQYIFVHIPKTGGTSLALALEARAMKDDILIGDTPKAKKRRQRLKRSQDEAGGFGSIRAFLTFWASSTRPRSSATSFSRWCAIHGTGW